MSDHTCQTINKLEHCCHCGKPWKSPGQSSFAATAGSVSAEQWWSRHAELLAAKMKGGGVKSFRIELNARGNYEFEVVPTETPNDPHERTGATTKTL